MTKPGLLKCEPIKLVLKDKVKPYYARRFPFSLMSKEKEEHNCMKNEGITEQITKLTDRKKKSTILDSIDTNQLEIYWDGFGNSHVHKVFSCA